MNRPPRFDASALESVLGDRARRVRWLHECAQALLRGEVPGRAAALFLGGAIASWLQNGGNLERDYFKVHRRGSHKTPAVLWRELRLIDDEGPQRGDPDSVALSSSRKNRK